MADSQTGLCDNGNFPLYNPGTGKIDCSFSPADALPMISACQADAMNNPDQTQQIINQAKTCCSSPTRKRNLWERTLNLFRRAGACTPSEPEAHDAAPPPMPTYTCPLEFPNVCANAKSAIETGGRSVTMTRKSGKTRYNGGWWNNKKDQQSHSDPDRPKKFNINVPIPGWGLQGCNVEEYPFASGNPSTSAVLRLVPMAENKAHGAHLDAFYKVWDTAAGNPALEGDARTNDGRLANMGRPFKIEFEPGVADKSTEWGLTDNAAGNICANPYGSDFLLVGGPYGRRDQWGE